MKHQRYLFALAVANVLGCADASSPAASSLAPTAPNASLLSGIVDRIGGLPRYSFVVIGCNRVDKADTAGNVSTANIEQLKRTFREISQLSPRPKFLFFAGDLTLGYTSDTVQLAKELTAWRALYEASPLANSGIELVAIPGNHETQSLSKISYAAAERTWLRIMAPYIGRGGNGPQAGGEDHLATDQSHLTYSFNYEDAHFITMNTDPVGRDWHVPVLWVAKDARAARQQGIRHIFAIGHKPAYPYPTIPTDGLAEDIPSRDSLWLGLMAANTEAMFSAHNHVWYRTQPFPGKTWQIIAGNGGSPLETTIDLSLPTSGEYYGFTLATVTLNGHVQVKSYGRNVPTAGYTAAAPESMYPTTVRDTLDIAMNALSVNY